MKSLCLILALFLAAPCDAGFEGPPIPLVFTSKGGRFLLTMVPGPKGHELAGGQGVCYKVEADGSLKEQWRISGWYSKGVELHDGGEFLVRTEPSLYEEDEDTKKGLAVAFYKNGARIRQYRVSNLVKDPSALEVQQASPWWQHLNASSRFLEDGGPLYQLTTVDGIRYTFNLEKGSIKSTEPGKGWE